MEGCIRKNDEKKVMAATDLVIRCDGCSKGNPGPSGAGYAIQVRGGRMLEKGSVFLGKCTNNQAEYAALIAAARAIKKRHDSYNRAIFITDSQLVVKQLNREWAIKDQILRKAAHTFREIMGRKRYTVSHVYRELNSMADGLADMAVSEGKSQFMTLNQPRGRRRTNK